MNRQSSVEAANLQRYVMSEPEHPTVEMYTYAQFAVHAAGMCVILQPTFFCDKNKKIYVDMLIRKKLCQK